MIAWLLRGLTAVFCLAAAGVAWWAWRATDAWYWATLALFATLVAVSGTTIALGFGLSFVANRVVPLPTGEPQRVLMTVRQVWRAFVGELLVSRQVFLVWQPWLASRTAVSLPAASAGRRGVVFIHGYFCNSALWRVHCDAARSQGVPYVALTLEPAFGDIDSYAALVHDAVQQLHKATGLAPLLVGHSMGGLAARAYVARHGTSAIERIITIGTPHHGTWHAGNSLGVNGRQMRLASPWLAANAALITAPMRGKFVCFYSNGDNIVAPTESAMLSGADNRFVAATGHVQLAFTDAVRAELAELLAA